MTPQQRQLQRRRALAWMEAAAAGMSHQQISEMVTIAAAGTTDTTIKMPAGATILGVRVLVATTVPCTTSFKVGDTGDTDRFGAAVSKLAGTDYYGSVTPYENTSALAVRITPDSVPSSDAGRVKVVIIYTYAK